MRRLIAKLLVAIAVLLMPLSMQSTAAVPIAHHPAMAMQHCPDQRGGHETKGALAECTMACAAALPAFDCRHDARIMIVGAPPKRSLAQVLHGISPETAIPPPRPA